MANKSPNASSSLSDVIKKQQKANISCEESQTLFDYYVNTLQANLQPKQSVRSTDKRIHGSRSYPKQPLLTIGGDLEDSEDSSEDVKFNVNNPGDFSKTWHRYHTPLATIVETESHSQDHHGAHSVDDDPQVDEERSSRSPPRGRSHRHLNGRPFNGVVETLYRTTEWVPEDDHDREDDESRLLNKKRMVVNERESHSPNIPTRDENRTDMHHKLSGLDILNEVERSIMQRSGKTHQRDLGESPNAIENADDEGISVMPKLSLVDIQGHHGKSSINNERITTDSLSSRLLFQEFFSHKCSDDSTESEGKHTSTNDTEKHIEMVKEKLKRAKELLTKLKSININGVQLIASKAGMVLELSEKRCLLLSKSSNYGPKEVITYTTHMLEELTNLITRTASQIRQMSKANASEGENVSILPIINGPYSLSSLADSTERLPSVLLNRRSANNISSNKLEDAATEIYTSPLELTKEDCNNVVCSEEVRVEPHDLIPFLGGLNKTDEDSMDTKYSNAQVMNLMDAPLDELSGRQHNVLRPISQPGNNVKPNSKYKGCNTKGEQDGESNDSKRFNTSLYSGDNVKRMAFSQVTDSANNISSNLKFKEPNNNGPQYYLEQSNSSRGPQTKTSIHTSSIPPYNKKSNKQSNTMLDLKPLINSRETRKTNLLQSQKGGEFQKKVSRILKKTLSSSDERQQSSNFTDNDIDPALDHKNFKEAHLNSENNTLALDGHRKRKNQTLTVRTKETKERIYQQPVKSNKTSVKHSQNKPSNLKTVANLSDLYTTIQELATSMIDPRNFVDNVHQVNMALKGRNGGDNKPFPLHGKGIPQDEKLSKKTSNHGNTHKNGVGENLTKRGRISNDQNADVSRGKKKCAVPQEVKNGLMSTENDPRSTNTRQLCSGSRCTKPRPHFCGTPGRFSAHVSNFILENIRSVAETNNKKSGGQSSRHVSGDRKSSSPNRSKKPSNSRDLPQGKGACVAKSEIEKERSRSFKKIERSKRPRASQEVQNWVVQAKEFCHENSYNSRSLAGVSPKRKKLPQVDVPKREQITPRGVQSSYPTPPSSPQNQKQPNSELQNMANSLPLDLSQSSPCNTRNAAQMIVDTLAETINTGIRKTLNRNFPKSKVVTKSVKAAKEIVRSISDSESQNESDSGSVTLSLKKLVKSLDKNIASKLDTRVCWDSSLDLPPKNKNESDLDPTETEIKLLQTGSLVLKEMVGKLKDKLSTDIDKAVKKTYQPETVVSFRSKASFNSSRSSSLKTSNSKSSSSKITNKVTSDSESYLHLENIITLIRALETAAEEVVIDPYSAYRDSSLGNVIEESQHAIAALEDLQELLAGLQGKKRLTRNHRIRVPEPSLMPIELPTVQEKQCKVTPEESGVTEMHGDTKITTTSRVPVGRRSQSNSRNLPQCSRTRSPTLPRQLGPSSPRVMQQSKPSSPVLPQNSRPSRPKVSKCMRPDRHIVPQLLQPSNLASRTSPQPTSPKPPQKSRCAGIGLSQSSRHSSPMLSPEKRPRPSSPMFLQRSQSSSHPRPPRSRSASSDCSRQSASPPLSFHSRPITPKFVQRSRTYDSLLPARSRKSFMSPTASNLEPHRTKPSWTSDTSLTYNHLGHSVRDERLQETPPRSRERSSASEFSGTWFNRKRSEPSTTTFDSSCRYSDSLSDPPSMVSSGSLCSSRRIAELARPARRIAESTRNQFRNVLDQSSLDRLQRLSFGLDIPVRRSRPMTPEIETLPEAVEMERDPCTYLELKENVLGILREVDDEDHAAGGAGAMSNVDQVVPRPKDDDGDDDDDDDGEEEEESSAVMTDEPSILMLDDSRFYHSSDRSDITDPAFNSVDFGGGVVFVAISQKEKKTDDAKAESPAEVDVEGTTEAEPTKDGKEYVNIDIDTWNEIAQNCMEKFRPDKNLDDDDDNDDHTQQPLSIQEDRVFSRTFPENLSTDQAEDQNVSYETVEELRDEPEYFDSLYVQVSESEDVADNILDMTFIDRVEFAKFKGSTNSSACVMMQSLMDMGGAPEDTDEVPEVSLEKKMSTLFEVSSESDYSEQSTSTIQEGVTRKNKKYRTKVSDAKEIALALHSNCDSDTMIELIKHLLTSDSDSESNASRIQKIVGDIKTTDDFKHKHHDVCGFYQGLSDTSEDERTYEMIKMPITCADKQRTNDEMGASSNITDYFFTNETFLSSDDLFTCASVDDQSDQGVLGDMELVANPDEEKVVDNGTSPDVFTTTTCNMSFSDLVAKKVKELGEELLSNVSQSHRKENATLVPPEEAVSMGSTSAHTFDSLQPMVDDDSIRSVDDPVTPRPWDHVPAVSECYLSDPGAVPAFSCQSTYSSNSYTGDSTMHIRDLTSVDTVRGVLGALTHVTLEATTPGVLGSHRPQSMEALFEQFSNVSMTTASDDRRASESESLETFLDSLYLLRNPLHYLSRASGARRECARDDRSHWLPSWAYDDDPSPSDKDSSSGSSDTRNDDDDDLEDGWSRETSSQSTRSSMVTAQNSPWVSQTALDVDLCDTSSQANSHVTAAVDVDAPADILFMNDRERESLMNLTIYNEVLMTYSSKERLAEFHSMADNLPDTDVAKPEKDERSSSPSNVNQRLVLMGVVFILGFIFTFELLARHSRRDYDDYDDYSGFL